MRLLPAVCENCELIADYHPNKENPNKQGDWLCPSCGFECNGSLFLYKKPQIELIELHTIIFKENRGHSVS